MVTRETWLSQITAAALFSIAVLVFSARLSVGAPSPYETALSSTATSFISNGFRDADARLVPLFAHGAGDTWFAPLPMYLAVASHTLWTSDPARLRWIPILLGALTVALFYMLVRRILAGSVATLIASAVLMLSPALVADSSSVREDGVWALPFVVVWLTGLHGYLMSSSSDRHLRLAGSVAALAALLYTQPSAGMMAAMLIAATGFVVYRIGIERRAIAWAAGAAAVVLAPLVVWLLLHPSAYADTFGRWVLHPAHLATPADWARSLTNWNGLTLVTQVAWDFFNPATLFLSHGTPAVPGIFLLPTVVLVVAGVSALARHRQTQPAHPIFLVACYGCPLVVLAAATFKEPDLTHRALAVTVFAALIAGLGAQAMLQRASAPGRLTVAAVSVAAAIQFGVWQVSR